MPSKLSQCPIDRRLRSIHAKLVELDNAKAKELLKKDVPWLIKAMKVHRKLLARIHLLASSPSKAGYRDVVLSSDKYRALEKLFQEPEPVSEEPEKPKRRR